MTFVRVDKSEPKVIEGFEYENRDGTVEQVRMNRPCSFCQIDLPDYESVHVYFDDIPKLIKALQAAYDLHNKEVA